jgi:CRISPR-associated protein Cas6
MYWEEDEQAEKITAGNDVVDLVFGLNCRCLPVDHMFALSQAVQKILPWLKDEAAAGLHTINVATSGNGWTRPDDPNALLHLSKRTRLELRVPAHRIEDAKKLEGARLDVAGNSLEIKTAAERPLSTLTTLFSRALATNDDIAGEEQVLDWIYVQLKALDIKPRKMMCGTEHFIATPKAPIRTRSLMIAGLEKEESLRLQQQGLGPHRHLGCGLFIPHKGIDDIRAKKD